MKEDKIILKKDFLKVDYNKVNINEVKIMIKDYDSYELLDVLEIYNLRNFEYYCKTITILNELEKRFPSIKNEIEDNFLFNKNKLLEIEELIKK